MVSPEEEGVESVRKALFTMSTTDEETGHHGSDPQQRLAEEKRHHVADVVHDPLPVLDEAELKPDPTKRTVPQLFSRQFVHATLQVYNEFKKTNPEKLAMTSSQVFSFFSTHLRIGSLLTIITSSPAGGDLRKGDSK